MSTLFEDTQLFNSGECRLQEFDLPDARLTLWEHFFSRQEADAFYQELLGQTPWVQEPITLYDKTFLTPRLTCWYGERYGGGQPVLPFTPALYAIKNKVEVQAGIQFTSVLLNLYRNGQDSVAWHRDNEPEFGVNPVIGSVSFGETRPFDIRHKYNRHLQKIRIPLHHGSFLLMAGPMQHYWEHAVPKTSKPVMPRINLTFRIVAQPATRN